MSVLAISGYKKNDLEYQQCFSSTLLVPVNRNNGFKCNDLFLDEPNHYV